MAKHNLDDEHLAFLGGVMMEAGSDSTSSTLLSFILAMVKYPEVLKKLQAEVDAVCGDERAPTFEDMPELPFVQACVFEVCSRCSYQISAHIGNRLTEMPDRL